MKANSKLSLEAATRALGGDLFGNSVRFLPSRYSKDDRSGAAGVPGKAAMGRPENESAAARANRNSEKDTSLKPIQRKRIRENLYSYVLTAQAIDRIAYRDRMSPAESIE